MMFYGKCIDKNPNLRKHQHYIPYEHAVADISWTTNGEDDKIATEAWTLYTAYAASV